MNVVADDGDELNFCSTCAFSSACLEHGYDKSRLKQLRVLVHHVGPYEEGQHIFREGDPFNAIAAIREGSVKTYVTALNGREQVQGFFLPGEVIGLNAISQSRYPCNALALETVTLCKFSFPEMATLASRLPELQEKLFRLLSADIAKATLLAGDFSADERLAAFLVTWSRRRGTQREPSNRLHLPMARTDIANYLRLAPETVSRLLKRLQDEGILNVERRDIEIVDSGTLNAMAANILRD